MAMTRARINMMGLGVCDGPTYPYGDVAMCGSLPWDDPAFDGVSNDVAYFDASTGSMVGSAIDPSTGAGAVSAVVPAPMAVTLPLLPTLSNSPASTGQILTPMDTGNLCNVANYVSANPVTTLVVAGIGMWLLGQIWGKK